MSLLFLLIKMAFKLHAPYSPAGDQPEAIEQLTNGLLYGERYQTLLGVTGSSKFFRNKRNFGCSMSISEI